MVFLNETGTIGIIINSITNEATGSLFLTLLIIVMGLMAFLMLLRVPLEFTAVIILPLLLTLMAYTDEFFTIGAVILMYLAVILTKMLFLR